MQGGIIGEYAAELQEEEPEKYQRQFKSYVDEGVDPEDLEDLYKEVHEAIRADPAHTKKERKKPAKAQRRAMIRPPPPSRTRNIALAVAATPGVFRVRSRLDAWGLQTCWKTQVEDAEADPRAAQGRPEGAPRGRQGRRRRRRVESSHVADCCGGGRDCRRRRPGRQPRRVCCCTCAPDRRACGGRFFGWPARHHHWKCVLRTCWF